MRTATEARITAAMLAAGVDEFDAWIEVADAEFLVKKIYQAMARKDPHQTDWPMEEI